VVGIWAWAVQAANSVGYGGKNFHPSQQQKLTLISIAAKKGI
jgi:hypothetical protein